MAIKNIINNDKLKSDIVDFNEFKYNQITKELRNYLIEFAYNQKLQFQIGEAYYIWKNNPDLLPEDYIYDEIDEITFSKFFDWFIYDFKLFDTAKNIVSTYYDTNKKNISQMESNILKKWGSSVFSYYTVNEISNGNICKITDIFTHKSIEVLDNSTAKKVRPLDILGARILQTESINYFSDVITIYPYAYKSLILDFYHSEFAEFKKSFKYKTTIKQFLKNWGYLIFQFLENISNNPKFLNSQGHEFSFIKSEFELYNYKEVMRLIDKNKYFKQINKQNDDINIYSLSLNKINEINGIIELQKNSLTLECYYINTHNKAKQLLELLFKDNIKYLKDDRKELHSVIINNINSKKYKIDTLPPGVKNKTEMDLILDNYYEEWLYKPLYSLDGITPIKASISQKYKHRLKTILFELEQLYEIARKRGEPYFDINILRSKLNL